MIGLLRREGAFALGSAREPSANSDFFQERSTTPDSLAASPSCCNASIRRENVWRLPVANPPGHQHSSSLCLPAASKSSRLPLLILLLSRCFAAYTYTALLIKGFERAFIGI